MDTLPDAPKTVVGAGGVRPMETYFTNNPTDDKTVGSAGALVGSTGEPRFQIRQEF